MKPSREFLQNQYEEARKNLVKSIVMQNIRLMKAYDADLKAVVAEIKHFYGGK